METKEYLQEIRKLDLLIEQKKYEYNTLKSLGTNIRAVDYSRARASQSGYSAGFTRHSDKVVDMARELQKDMQYFDQMRHERIKEIQTLDRSEYVDLLFKRYVEYKTLEVISREMEYSYKHIGKMHADALKAFERKKEEAEREWKA